MNALDNARGLISFQKWKGRHSSAGQFKERKKSMSTQTVAISQQHVNHNLLPEERRILRRARLLARRHGMMLRKSRRRLENAGHYRLTATTVIAGEQFDLTAEDIIRICQAAEKPEVPGNEATISQYGPI